MEKKTHEGVIAVRGKGIGFVSLPDREEDIFIDSDRLGTALDGDVVRISLLEASKGRRAEGKVEEVVERKHAELIGVVRAVEKKEGVFELFPDNRRIHVRHQLRGAEKKDVGMKVVVSLEPWLKKDEIPKATITEVLGEAGKHETEMQAIIRSGNFSESFPPPVAESAQKLYEDRQRIFEEATKDPNRRDMRSVATFTIDPADAKDFDDALSFRVLDDGSYEIGIHIADVSHYVEEGGHIDMEARDRGTSIYLVDRVIPMLPEVLSNDLCSLRPHEDRLAFSAVFVMDKEARVKDQWFGQTIIHSDHRFTYENAQKVLDDGGGDHHDELKTLMQLSRTLRKKRYQKGAIAFEQPEVRFELDEDGAPIRAYVKHRTETMLMIEDFMLLANQRVATHIHSLSKDKGKNLAFVYRIHDVPDPDRVEELALFINALGYEFKTNKGMVAATDINKLLKDIEGTPEETLIKTATIRSMAKAVYSTKNIGHFGLAFRYYTHFTSPIRRYPDLMVHRMLRRHLDGRPISGQEAAVYERLSIQSSQREMEAVRAERDSIQYKQVEYMQDKVGQIFDGVITGVTDWGVYVAEKESQAEGLVRLANLKDDYYSHESGKYHVKGEKTGKKYRLGDQVRIKLTRADLEEKQLDFTLV